ncbi:MAG: ATP-binding cassette domain-containing protein [Rhodospirillales bacterium]|nr:ATP-binding cassette domain-containing protein [Rhodospirillales bacterium]
MFKPRRQQPGNGSENGNGERPRSRDFGHLRRLAPYLLPYRKQIAGALAALLLAAITVLGLGAGLRVLVDDGLARGNDDLLDSALFALIAIVIMLAGASFARFYLVSWIGERVVADLRRDVYDRVITLPPSCFEVTRTGEVLSRLTTDTAVLQTVIGSSLSMALRNILLLIGGMIMLAVTSFKMTVVVILLVPVVLMPILVFGRMVRTLSRLSQDRIADIGHRVDETLNAIPTVQAFAREDFEGARFGNAVEEAFGTATRRIRARAFLTATVILLVFGGIGGVLWMGGHDVVSGDISGGDLAAFVFYAVLVAASVGALSEVYGDLQRAAGAAERLSELLAVEPSIASPALPECLPQPSPGTIAVSDVTFRYPARPDEAVLQNVTFDVAGGETVALVGPSGAGKSTLFQLLLRFHDPGAGSVAVDGVDVRRAPLDLLRERLALVPQEPVIFGATIAENILYGRPDASDADVRRAADAAFATGFVERLPEDFHTFVGERGVRLSAGQRQRLAIARAVLKDAPILLLDEATSALDAESEQMVQQALERLMEGRTTLVIAHRLATILKADRILVLENGQIVEAGRHEQLVAAGGLYARLAELQFDIGNGGAGGGLRRGVSM